MEELTGQHSDTSGTHPGRWWMLILGLILCFLVPFFAFNHTFARLFSAEGITTWLEGYAQFAWLAGMLLLILDVFLPLPGTLIMAGLGYLYGPLAGGAMSVMAIILSSILAYWLCRVFGIGFTRKFLGQGRFEKGQQTMREKGPWYIALTRWLPILSEVTACLAGLTKMPFAMFFLATACGAVPLGFIFAFLGSTGQENPMLAVILNLTVPAILWLFVWLVIRKSKRSSVR